MQDNHEYQLLLDRLDTDELSESFDDVANTIYDYQLKYNPVFQEFVASLPPIDYLSVEHHYLPISAFKRMEVKCDGPWEEEKVFTSSGTTGSATSRHYIRDNTRYLRNCVRGFQEFIGNVKDHCFLALLPSYQERDGSSLIEMIDYFMRLSSFDESGYFLYNHRDLLDRLRLCRDRKVPTVLFGVSYALLDFCTEYNLHFPELIIMETGGMKGRAKEMPREELHFIFQESLGVARVYSEYGMTELMSQAYSKGEGLFYPASTMKIEIREVNDPFTKVKDGKSGIIHILDIANIDSCSFIATEDLGVRYADGSFRILGRLDNSDLRGCNLLLNE